MLGWYSKERQTLLFGRKVSDMSDVETQLTNALRYQQLCLDILPKIDPDIDARIQEALEPDTVESMPLDIVDCNDMLVRFPGIFAEDGTAWVNLSVVEPAHGEIVRFKMFDNTTQVCMWTKHRDLVTPIGIVLQLPTHWCPCTDQDKIDFHNLCSAHNTAMENITDLYA